VFSEAFSAVRSAPATAITAGGCGTAGAGPTSSAGRAGGVSVGWIMDIVGGTATCAPAAASLTAAPPWCARSAARLASASGRGVGRGGATTGSVGAGTGAASPTGRPVGACRDGNSPVNAACSVSSAEPLAGAAWARWAAKSAESRPFSWDSGWAGPSVPPSVAVRSVSPGCSVVMAWPGLVRAASPGGAAVTAVGGLSDARRWTYPLTARLPAARCSIRSGWVGPDARPAVT